LHDLHFGTDHVEYQYLKIERTNEGKVMEIILNRPQKLNMVDHIFFKELDRALHEIEQDESVRVAIIWAEGNTFSAGLDLKAASATLAGSANEVSKASHSKRFYRNVTEWQNVITHIEKCNKPIVAAINGVCLGAGVDLVSACDIRLVSKDASFSIKETQIAIVADLGTLQRIQKTTSKGFAREMAFTGDSVSAQRAFHFGFVNEVFETKDDLLKGARKMAENIAKNSPLAVQGTKIALNYAEQHTTQDALDQVTLWNTSFLHSDDLVEAITSFVQKRKPNFNDTL